MWVMLGVSCLFLILGGIFILTGGGASIIPSSIHLAAAGLYKDSAGVYCMDVYKKETPLTVSTKPKGASEAVEFQIIRGQDCLSVTPRIWPGASAVLTLLADSNGSYQFGRSVEILIKSKYPSEVLKVNICLPPDQVTFGFQIRNRITEKEFRVISSDDYKKDVYGGTNDVMPTKNNSLFKFYPELKVFGTTVKASLVTFTAMPQDLNCRARLLDIGKNDPVFPELPNGFSCIYIPAELLEKPNASEPVRFKITASYMGQEFIDFFDLYIVE
jgi:hypothetical protein